MRSVSISELLDYVRDLLDPGQGESQRVMVVLIW